jgi:hypothetical protein
MANRSSSGLLASLLVLVVLLAPAVAAISLSNIQLISAPEVQIQCMSAYSTELLGCDRLTTSPGARCTARCRNSIANVELALQASCASVQPAQGSILFAAQAGLLVDTICGAGGPKSPEQPAASASPTEAAPVVTVTRAAGRIDETLVTAPLPTPIVGLADEAPRPLPSNTVTITTAIQPMIPGGGAPGSNPRPTGGATPNDPMTGGNRPFDSAAGPSAPSQAALVYFLVAGSLLVLLQ